MQNAGGDIAQALDFVRPAVTKITIRWVDVIPAESVVGRVFCEPVVRPNYGAIFQAG